MNEEFIFLLERLVPALNKGVLVSLQLIVPSAILGIFFGVTMALQAAAGKETYTSYESEKILFDIGC